MAISIYSNRGIKNYGIKHYILDTNDDLVKMPINCTPGSTAFITESSKYYMLNNQKQWVLVNIATGGNSGGGSGDFPDIHDGDTVIFNGGSPI